MVILGIWDGVGAGVALVLGDRLVAVAHADVASRGIPWELADELLSQAKLTRADVDLVAIAGRFTPPLVLRRHPEWSTLGSAPFALARSAGTRWQSLLRRTGLGALDADRAAQWFEERLRERGYQPRRVVMVDIHKALAAAAYRCQPDDDALVVIAHPHGDGALLSAHSGRAGQLDRIDVERGAAASHLWFDRCLSVAKIRSDRALYACASAPPDLGVDLGLELVHGRLAVRAPAMRGPARGPWRVLAEMSGSQAASAISATLREHLGGWLREKWPVWSARGEGARSVAIGGSWAQDPRLVAALTELPGIEHVWAGPWLGTAALPVGAALCMGGTAPALVQLASRSSLPSQPRHPAALAAVLERGDSVAWLDGDGLGGGAALVRADHSEARERARLALGRPVDEHVQLWGLSAELPIEREGALSGPLRYATAAPRLSDSVAPAVRGQLAPDGRSVVKHIHSLELAEILDLLRARTGSGVVAAYPLAFGADSAVTRPNEALHVCHRAKFPVLDLGRDGVIWAEGGA